MKIQTKIPSGRAEIERLQTGPRSPSGEPSLPDLAAPTQIAPVGSGMSPRDLAKLVSTKSALAGRYAALGLPRLAQRRLFEAESAWGRLAEVVHETAQGPHMGLTAKGLKPAKEEARKKLDAAREAIQTASAQPPPPLGPPSWKKTVLLFGSSVNPPTGLSGHGGIVAWGAKHQVDIANDKTPEAAREQVPVDEVWVLPVYRHLFASKSNLLPFPQRFQMAELAFSDLPGLEGRIKVKDTERELVEQAVARAQAKGQPLEQVRVGTIDIIRHLEAQHPETKFVLALGADTYQDLLEGKWKEGDKLMAGTEIVVVPRVGVSSVTGLTEDAPRLGEVSSTTIRASADLDYLSNPDILHPKVLEFMRANHLYGFAKET